MWSVTRNLPGFLFVFDWLYSIQYFTSFSQLIIILSMCLVFDAVSSNILSIESTVDVFVFGNFMVHHKGWFNYSSETDSPGEI